MNKVFRLLSVGLLAALSGCAGPHPVFTPPLERPLAVRDTPWPRNQVLVLAYHDIMDTEPDQQYVATRTANFIAQMRWLQVNHYVPVSMDQIFAASEGKGELPEKAVLLTFDDGYRSMYDRVFPILKRNHWPALFAPVGRWIDTPEGQSVDFSGKLRPRDKFVTWDQVREMSDSGLVEIGSHTQDLHHGVLANPQGNVEPAAAALKYDPVTKRYETLEEFRQRIDRDVSAITSTLTRVDGKPPRVWVWPYGAASGIALDVARQHHYRAAMTLEDGLLDVHNLMNVPRMLVANDPDIDGFVANAVQLQEHPPIRSVRVDLDAIYDPDPAQMEENVGRVVQRLSEVQPTVIIVKGFVSPAHPGEPVRETYFPNHVLPMKADLFNRTVHQIHSRLLFDPRVYAWIPTLAAEQGASVPLCSTSPYRASPFSPVVQRQLRTLYRDMAASVPTLEGVMFDEDASDAVCGGESPARLTQAQDDLSVQLSDEVRAVRGQDVKTLQVVVSGGHETARQAVARTLTHHDHALVRLSPGARQGAGNVVTHAQAQALLKTVSELPNGMARTLFEVERQTPTGKVIADERVGKWLVWLANRSVIHLGYAPDDAQANRPVLRNMAPLFESRWQE
ncbi:poly-beta-1,6-N-acetyl-D-glucosamine N-deacetylase PgaB [Zymobacter sp. IVIA_5232.4 C2]|uniref:poly-beta-1,6-N-acetyl-D-glucosamine N-deacetylase PgaB n=1 Tax=Zymobacter sp. IVIA_5232.4 C2 TaxID=3394855 RepID=UPI0039C4D45E